MTTSDHNRRLRNLYEAAIHAELDSAVGRTFEEWDAKVSDYGLDDAQTALESWVFNLQISLATAFVSMQATYNPGERQGYWLECLRLAKELEKLNHE